MMYVLIVIGVVAVLGAVYSYVSASKVDEIHWDWDKEDIDSIYSYSWPKDFLWGTATAAFQVEGTNAPSNWTMWEESVDAKGVPRIKDAQRVGKSCDHLNLYADDIKNMNSDLGCNSYRFSVAWSRVEPEEGKFDQNAIDHYSKMIDACLENGVEPMVTFHHFSHPLWFEKKGSFERQENIHYFHRFAKKLFQNYSDRVTYWCTHNECAPFATMGWGLGVFPPGVNAPKHMGNVLLNLMRSHSGLYHLLKAEDNASKVQVGLVKNIFQFDPWSRWNPVHWLICNYVDEIYNESLIGTIRDGHFRIRAFPLLSMDVSMPEAKGATDFIGLNYYSQLLINLRRGADPFSNWKREGQIMTDFPYATYPEGFYRAIKRISQLNKPIIVTENGIPDNQDDRREDWIVRYVYAMKKAMSEGIDIRGYHYWSLLDNFEWAEGYDMRFGLYEVNFETQERKLREGAKCYGRIIKGVQKEA